MRCVAAVLLIVVGGCASISGAENSDVSVSLFSEFVLPPAHTFRVTVDGQRIDLPLGTSADRNSLTREAPAAGDRPVTAELVDSRGVVLSGISFTQQYFDDRNHWVAAHLGARRPIGHCIGSLLATPLPASIARTSADSLFVMFGSLPRGAVC